MEKSSHIYLYEPLHKILKKVGELNMARSSHSIVCLQKMIYVVGGMVENEKIPKKCEVFDTRTNQTRTISSCKYQTINSTLCALGK